MNFLTQGRVGIDGRQYSGEVFAPRLPIGIEPSRIYRLVRRNKYPVLITIAICLLASVTISELQTPMFSAEALIEIQGLNGNFLKSSEYQPVATEGRTADAFMATQIRLLKSEELARKVVELTHLNENRLYFRTSQSRELLRRTLHFPLAAEHASVSDTALRLAKGLTVSTVGDSDLISLRVDAPDPALAATLSNAFASEYIKEQQQDRLNTSLQTSNMLSDQLEEFRVRLQDSEHELQEYAKSAGLLFTDEHSMATDEQLRLVQTDLARAQADRAEKQAELHLLASAEPDSLPKVLDDGPLRDLKLRLTDLQRQLAELGTTLTPKNYKVETVQAEIRSVESAVDRERTNVLSRIQNEYAASAQREQLLQKSYENQARIVTGDSAKAVHYNVLRREVDANRDIYGSMMQKVKEASVLSALQMGSMRLADAARAPLGPYRPDFLKNGGLGTLAGIICAMLLVLLRERLDRTLNMRGEMMHVLEVPELGVIPSAVSKRNPGRLELKCGQIGPGDSLLTEAFQCTAMSIFSNPRTCKVFLITSPQPRAGKSTVVVNLGRALAESGRRGVLVDGDLRRPMLHSVFSISRSPGLVEILKGEPAVAAATAVCQTAKTGSTPPLSVIPAGASSSSDWGLLQSAGMKKLVADLRQQYEFVLIDSPPMLQLTDARILARMADAVVLVCRAGQTRREQMLEAARLLEVDGSALLGTILNDWDVRTEDPEYIRSYHSYIASGA